MLPDVPYARPGISDHSIRTCSLLRETNATVAASSSPSVCYLAAGASPTEADLQYLLDVSRTNDLVLKSIGAQQTPVLLVRSEALRAVGGFDEALTDPELATLDLCLKARMRNFSCSTQSSEGRSRVGMDAALPSELNDFIARWGLEAPQPTLPMRGPRLL